MPRKKSKKRHDKRTTGNANDIVSTEEVQGNLNNETTDDISDSISTGESPGSSIKSEVQCKNLPKPTEKQANDKAADSKLDEKALLLSVENEPINSIQSLTNNSHTEPLDNNPNTSVESETPSTSSNDITKLSSKLASRRIKIPVLINILSEESVNPFSFCKETAAILGYRPDGRKLGGVNAYRLVLHDESDIQKFKQCPAICNKPFEIKQEFCSLKAKIYVPVKIGDLELSDEFLYHSLKESGVLAAKRIKRHPFNIETGKVTEVLTSFVVLTFKDYIPHHVTVDDKQYKVRTHVEAPVQCFKCQKFGHVAAYCKSKEHCCRFCAKSHTKQDCDKAKEKCANCAGSHPSTFGGCSVRKKYLAASKLKQKEVIHSWKSALSSVSRKENDDVDSGKSSDDSLSLDDFMTKDILEF